VFLSSLRPHFLAGRAKRPLGCLEVGSDWLCFSRLPRPCLFRKTFLCSSLRLFWRSRDWLCFSRSFPFLGREQGELGLFGAVGFSLACGVAIRRPSRCGAVKLALFFLSLPVLGLGAGGIGFVWRRWLFACLWRRDSQAEPAWGCEIGFVFPAGARLGAGSGRIGFVWHTCPTGGDSTRRPGTASPGSGARRTKNCPGPIRRHRDNEGQTFSRTKQGAILRSQAGQIEPSIIHRLSLMFTVVV